MAERITFYSVKEPGKSRSAYPIDAIALLQSPDWTTNPNGNPVIAVEEPVAAAAPKAQVKPEANRVTRQNELQEIAAKDQGWRELKAIASAFTPPIEKEADGDWESVIPLILDREFPKG